MMWLSMSVADANLFFVNRNWLNCFQVNHNGHLTFSEQWSSYTPQRFPLNGFRDIISPFWTDLDNTINGQIYYNQYTNGNILQQATQDINSYFPGLNFNANWVFVATWYEVAYYPNTGTVSHLVLKGKYIQVYVYFVDNYSYIYNHKSFFFSEQRSKQCWSLVASTHLCWWTMIYLPKHLGMYRLATLNYIQCTIKCVSNLP